LADVQHARRTEYTLDFGRKIFGSVLVDGKSVVKLMKGNGFFRVWSGLNKFGIVWVAGFCERGNESRVLINITYNCQTQTLLVNKTRYISYSQVYCHLIG